MAVHFAIIGRESEVMFRYFYFDLFYSLLQWPPFPFRSNFDLVGIESSFR